MRIIAGARRGQVLKSPKNMNIRPTSDRAREGVFNILQHRYGGIKGQRFLDLYCGTAAMGCEALSRGAQYVLSVDCDAEAKNIALHNLRQMHDQIDGLSQFMRTDVVALPSVSPAFDVVYMDPPYRDETVNAALQHLVYAGYVGRDSLVIVEQDRRVTFDPPKPYSVRYRRAYGRTVLWFLAVSTV